MAKMMKTDKALLNVILNVIVQILNIVLTLAVRRTFLLLLGDDVLGLNSLYASILSFMALSELGIGVTIAVTIYKPLAENNQKKVAAYMCLLRKVYILTGIFILAAGIVMMPALHLFIKGDFDPDFIYGSFQLYIISVAVTYFFSYKKILIGADQKSYILSASQAVYKVVLNVSQLIVLIVFRDYCLFILTAAVCNFTENFIMSVLCSRMYPYIRDSAPKLSRNEKKDLRSKVLGMLCNKAGSYLIEGMDNIIISAVLGTAAVAHYNNYYLIINLLYAVFANIAVTSSAGMGNILYTDKKRLRKTFSKLMLVQQFVFSFSGTAFLILSSYFVETVFAGTTAYRFPVLMLMTMIYYIKGYSEGLEAVRNCAGEYGDKYVSLALSVFNVAVSVFLVNKTGIAGVLTGTLLCYSIKGIITVPVIVFQKIMPGGQKHYYLSLVKNLGITAVIMVSAKMTETVFPVSSWIRWVLYGIFIFIYSLMVNIAFAFRTDEYRELKQYCISIYKRMKAKTG